MNFARDFPIDEAFEAEVRELLEELGVEHLIADWRPRSESAPGPLEEAFAERGKIPVHDLENESPDLTLYLDELEYITVLFESRLT